MKKIISALLALAMTAAALFSPVGITAAGRKGDTNGDGEIDNKDVVILFRYVSGGASGAVEENCDYNGDGAIDNKDVVALFRAVSSGNIPSSEDPGERFGSGWDVTVSNANGLANAVQGRFTSAERKKFLIENGTSSLLYDLSTHGRKQIEGLYNADGKPYFENTGDAYILSAENEVFSAALSPVNGRMNSHRIGYYYYDFRFCDQRFLNAGAQTEGGTYDVLKNSYGWAGNDVKNISKNADSLSFTVTSSYDPYIHTSGVKFSAEQYNAVRLTIRTEYASSGNIYLVAGSKNSFSEAQRADFSCMPGQDTTVYVSFSDLEDYTGSVKAFRIDCGDRADEKIVIKEITAVKRGKDSVPLALERIFHTFSSKMHEVVRAVATVSYSDGGRLETKTVIPAKTVQRCIFKNADGESALLSGFDFSSAEYVAFDIKDAGIYGVIMPSLDNNGYIKVELKDGNYIITRGKEITSTVLKGKDVVFGHRIYTSASHSFDELREEAYAERNPLTDISVKSADSAKFEGYNKLVGTYKFSVKASDFNEAYYKKPDKHYRIETTVKGDGRYDRLIYVQTFEKNGQLECAAILDENDRMLPIPLEVGKNFCGEKEEPLYDPADPAYGEVYVPLTVNKSETKKFSLLHLYQNWGNYPLKQLSFIAFHIPYYHLSVGVTETNCIAPYFVYGKDGWTLPDFRANSAPLWSGQPQHTSAGRLYFLQYKDADGKSYKSESQSADIVSAGPVYADINMEYLSDDGRIKATYRHAETAQTDENRTYYNIRLEVLEDIKIRDFKNDFSFFTFDGRSVAYSKVGYLSESGASVVEDVKNTDRIIKLGKEYPYYDYFGGNVTDSVNFVLIVRKSDITVGGKKYDGNFVFKDKYDGSLNFGSLSLDLGAVTLKKGDVLEIEMILMPWGYGTSKNDSNVRNVRKDSCIDPYKLTVVEGTPVTDVFIPSVRAKNNKAVFKLSGGKSTAAVRVYGFTGYDVPEVTFKLGGKTADIKLAGQNGYDGYQVYLDEDGTYSYSFNVNMDKTGEYEITVTQ